MSVDPLIEQTGDAYGYCYQNPIRFIDPDGRAPGNPPAYYMNDRGFWIQGEPSFGEYIGNVRPLTDRYMELTRIDGTLYHKNTSGWFGKKAYSAQEERNNDLIRAGGDFAVMGIAFKALGGIAGQLLKNAGNSLWKVASINRGFVYESMLNLKGTFKTSNFPIIDAFYQGVATSVKTLNLAAKSYSKGNTVFNRLKGYVDELSNFQGAAWGDDVVRVVMLKARF